MIILAVYFLFYNINPFLFFIIVSDVNDVELTIQIKFLIYILALFRNY